MTQQERLAVCLWLAKWCGLRDPRIDELQVFLHRVTYEGYAAHRLPYDPFSDAAQRMQLVERAWMEGYVTGGGPRYVECSRKDAYGTQEHDRTPASIAEAVCLSIAMATGFKREEG